MPDSRHRGFSLIELMTVLLIVGLLLALAWPSYRQHVQRGHRAEALAALMQARLFMERHYAVHGRYTTAAGQAPELPQALRVVPPGGPARYLLSVELDQAGGFVLRAAPQLPMADDPCGSLLLASTGAQGRSGSALTVQQCWR